MALRHDVGPLWLSDRIIVWPSGKQLRTEKYIVVEIGLQLKADVGDGVKLPIGSQALRKTKLQLPKSKVWTPSTINHITHPFI